MDRDIPNFNPIVVGRMQQKQLQLHHQRLQNIKPFNQSRVTTSANHNRHNKKALQQEEDKKTEIERNNLILFNKMLKIMKRNDPCNRAVTTANRVNARTSVELSRIQEQNRTMYERIEKQKPTIDNRKLYEQRKKQENILKFLGKYSAHSLQNTQAQSLRYEYPKENGVSGQRRPNKQDHYLQKLQNQQLNFEKEARYEQIELEEQIDEEQFRAHTRGYQNRSKKSYSTNHTTYQIVNKPETPKNMGSVEQNERKVPTSAKDIILFKSKKDIQMQKYEIKIVRSHLAYEIRATAIGEDLEDPIKLVLSENAGNLLLEDNDYDYRRIIEKVALRGNQLILSQANPGSEEEHQEQQQDYHPPQPFSRKNKKEAYMNPSHISEQNEEDSYRSPDSIGYSPARNTKRVDSLGPQHTDNICVEQAEGINTEQAENGQAYIVCEMQEEEEERLQEQQSERNQEQQLERNQVQRNRKVIQLQERGGFLQSNYEEALQEEII